MTFSLLYEERAKVVNFCLFTLACYGNKPATVSNDKELITSPLYPEPYPRHQTCTWIVTAPDDKTVGFKFTDFELAPGDFVEVRDGKNKTDELLNFFNRSKVRLNHWWTSTGQFLLVWFKTINKSNSRGLFRMTIKFVRTPKG